MRGKDLLYDLSFLDDDLVEEAGRNDIPKSFKKYKKSVMSANAAGDMSRSKKGSRRRLIAMAACLMLAVAVTASLSRMDLKSFIDSGRSSDGSDLASEGTEGKYSISDDADENNTGEEDSVAVKNEEEEAAGDEAADAASGKGETKAASSLADQGGKGEESSSQQEGAGDSGDAASGGSADQNAYSENMNQDSGAFGTCEGTDKAYPEAGEAPLASQSPGIPEEEADDSTTGASAGRAAGNNTYSQELFDYLYNLDYTENADDSLDAEYTVEDSEGNIYYINLTQRLVFTAAGRAELSLRQAEDIKNILQDS